VDLPSLTAAIHVSLAQLCRSLLSKLAHVPRCSEAAAHGRVEGGGRHHWPAKINNIVVNPDLKEGCEGSRKEGWEGGKEIRRRFALSLGRAEQGGR
jgi:hypothetical protein